MEFTNKSKMMASILAICFIGYNVLLFVIFGIEDHEGIFWLSWFFMILAFAAMTFSGVVLGKNGMLMRDWLFGYPIVKHSTIYIIAELIASTLFIILEETVSFALAFGVQFLFLCCYGVCAISCFLAKSTIEDVRNKVAQKTEFMKLLRVDAEMLVEKCQDPQLKAELQQLAEAIRFSDPMSSDALADIEREISFAVSECSRALDIGTLDKAGELCRRANFLLIERNKKCKVLK